MENEHLDLENRANETGVTKILNTNTNHSDADTLENILSHIGGLGRYQRLLIIGMLLFGFTYAFMYYGQLFITVTPQNYWCKIPELANLSMELRRNLSAPGADTGNWDHCKTFDVNWTKVLDTLIVPPPETPTVPCQHGWEFEFSDIPYETVTTQREWVCDHASYVPTAQSVFFCGGMVGTVMFGWIADRFGRIPAIIGTNLIGGIGGIATTFTTGVWDFMLCRFISGLGFDNCSVLIYILVLEFVGPQYRTVVANLYMASTYGTAAISLPWIALYISNWQLLLQIISLPMFLVLLAKWYIPESIRWLVSQGRIKEVVQILRRFESINGAEIPDDVMDDFMISSKRNILDEELSILCIFKSPPLYKAVLKTVVVYMGATMMLDGLIRLSGTFGMNFFTIFSFNEVFEIMGISLCGLLLDRFGRRNVYSIATFLCAVILFSCLFLCKGFTIASLAIAARFFGSMSITTIMQWSTEILPTPFRATGTSVFHMSSFVAVILSTFIMYLERVWSIFPLLVFIAVASIASSVALTLPETKGLPLPENVADGEKLISEYSLCGKGVRFTVFSSWTGLALATLAIGARFFASVSATSINQWVTEILPTHLRATGASIINISTFVAIILSTFIAYSERIWSMLPLFIIIAVSVVTSYISITLPETKGKPLPQTMADAEKLINDYSLCGKAKDALDCTYKRCGTE